MKARRPLRICVLGLGGGGFQGECQLILRQVQRPLELILIFAGPDGGVRSWQGTHPVSAIYFLRSPSLMGDTLGRSLFYGCVNLIRAAEILVADQPDLVLATGTAQAIPFALACRILGRPLWFIESVTRVRRPSRTGAWLHRLRLATELFYYWPTLRSFFPRGICFQPLS